VEENIILTNWLTSELKRTHYQQQLETFTGNIQFAPPRIHEAEPAFNFGDFCFTKKADSMLLLRTGARTISCLGLSNDLNAVKGLKVSNNSCKLKFLCYHCLNYQGRFKTGISICLAVKHTVSKHNRMLGWANQTSRFEITSIWKGHAKGHAENKLMTIILTKICQAKKVIWLARKIGSFQSMIKPRSVFGDD
jgi:hypothetical protein